jgi:hypothetical protein
LFLGLSDLYPVFGIPFEMGWFSPDQSISLKTIENNFVKNFIQVIK